MVFFLTTLDSRSSCGRRIRPAGLGDKGRSNTWQPIGWPGSDPAGELREAPLPWSFALFTKGILDLRNRTSKWSEKSTRIFHPTDGGGGYLCR